MTLKVFVIAFLLSILFLENSFAQKLDTLKVLPSHKPSFLAVPYLLYSPETKFGIGATALTTFRFKSEKLESRPSSVQVGVAYTQLKQIEFYLPYTLFFGKGKYITVGDLWYYKYTYFFYGVGNSNPVDYSEKYGVNTPRLRLTILKKITNSLFLGFRSYIQSFNTYDLEPNGQLASGNIIGAKGNKTSSIGLATWYDTRDGIFFPRNGIFVDAHILKDSPAWGSDYIFTRALIDATHYLPIGNSSVLATNIVTSSIYGDAPFQELNFLGGPKKMRGYYLGHFRDKNIWLLQSEFRSLISPRLGYTLFADAGSIAPTYAELLSSRIRFTLGAGLRIVLNKSERMTARVDAGFGPHTSGVYVTVGEAF